MECPCCWEEMNETEETICPNNHKVCPPCLQKVMEGRNPKCPLCRHLIRNDSGRPAPVPRFQIRRTLGGEDAIGRRGGGRPHNGPVWDQQMARFQENLQNNRIPPGAVFGGIHERKCGHRECYRQGGAQGVRFLVNNTTGTRVYRCEEHTNN